MNLLLSDQELQELRAILDHQTLGSFHVSGLCRALVNMMAGVYDGQRLTEALKAMDLDGDGKLHVDELRYFVEKYGHQLEEWQMHKVLGIIEGSTVGLYEEEGMVVIEKLVQNIWEYG